MGVGRQEIEGLRDAVFIHCAANLNFKEQLRVSVEKTNCLGIENVLAVFRMVGGRSLFHLSTSYVCGRLTGRIAEVLHPKDTRLNNVYESSKAKAEAFLMDSDLAGRSYILRPSVVVGSSKTGYAINFSGYYNTYKAVYGLRQDLERLGRLPTAGKLNIRFVGDPDLKIDVVAVDYVAECIANIIEEAGRRALTQRIFHLCHPDGYPLQYYLDRAQEHVGLKGLHFVRELKKESLIERQLKERLAFNNIYTKLAVRFDDSHNRQIQKKYGLGYIDPAPAVFYRINDFCADFLRNRSLTKEFSAGESNCGAGTRTQTLASKGPCATITPPRNYKNEKILPSLR